MNNPTSENQLVLPTPEVVQQKEETGLSPEEIAAHEQAAMKRMMLMATEMQDWLEEAFGLRKESQSPEEVAQKVASADSKDILTHIFDFNNELVIITRMLDLHTYQADDQKELLSKWRSLAVDQTKLNMVSLPEGRSVEEQKELIQKFASAIQSISGVEGISSVFTSKYKKVNGAVVELTLLDLVKDRFATETLNVSDIQNIKQFNKLSKADAQTLYDQEIVPTLQGLYQLLLEYNFAGNPVETA